MLIIYGMICFFSSSIAVLLIATDESEIYEGQCCNINYDVKNDWFADFEDLVRAQLWLTESNR